MNDHQAIINAYLDDELTESQYRDLVAWIRSAPDHRKHFVTECYLHSHLQDIFLGERATRDVSDSDPRDGEAVSLSCAADAFSIHPNAGLRSPVIGLAAPLGDSPGHFFSGWPVAYLIATAIFAVGLVIGALVQVSHPSQLVTPSSPLPSPLSPLPSPVARITAMVDCVWETKGLGIRDWRLDEGAGGEDGGQSDSSLSTLHSPLVSIGDTLALRSGLLELTYDSGAKVILQGPVTYEVESSAGGYLAVGKLTAKLEKKVASGQWPVVSNRKSSSPQSLATSPSPNPSLSPDLCPLTSDLFAIRTPTALVTDLGTEFGVEVDKQGRTKSHVFVGTVKISRIAEENSVGQAEILHAGQSARCDKSEPIVVSSASGKVDRFVRSLPMNRTKVTRIIETFDGERLDAALEQMPPGRYVNKLGAAVYQEPPENQGKLSRGYIRTVATDFCDRDFMFEATFEVRLDAAHKTNGTHFVYLGIGDGVPNANFYDEITSGLLLAFSIDDGRLFVRLCRPDASSAYPEPNKTVADLATVGILQAGKHRMRMAKMGNTVRFSLDADFNGRFGADFHGPALDLPTVAPFLNATNSRLLVGTGYSDTMTVSFRDLSITYSDTPKHEEAIRPHK